ncbi:hypothetical protein RFUL19S_04786 [Rhizobacter fulvus]
MLAKLAEVLFIEVLRLCMNAPDTERTGWLAGVGDRIVGKAPSELHERPAHAWTLEELARSAPARRQSASRSWARSFSPSSGLCANGSVGLRGVMMSSSRTCTLPSDLGWL